MKHIKIPAVLSEIHDVFSSHGYSCYLVGGAVRDMLRGKKAADYDLATDAQPEHVIKMFKRVIPTGIAHGTVTIHYKGQEFETTTFRTENSYSDGRHPDTISYASSIIEDLSRRDFTMNAVAVSLEDGTIIDPFYGQKDITNKIIKAVGSPVERFTEDGLRPVRAVRFASQLDFIIEEQTLAAVFSTKQVSAKISKERFRDEFIKMLSTEKPSKALLLLEQTGLLEIFIPELASCRNVEQADIRGYHILDVLDHLIASCDGAPADNIDVRLAALFHDIGKPAAKKTEMVSDIKNQKTSISPIHTFYNHEKHSVKITQAVMERLKFPNKTIDTVCHLIEHHMFHYEPSWTDAAVRRFIVRVTPEAVNDLFDLRLADMYGKANAPVLPGSPGLALLAELKDRIGAVLKEKDAISIKDLAVSGKDLIASGIQPGKQLGYILQTLIETVLDDPALNTKDTLLRIAQRVYEKLS